MSLDQLKELELQAGYPRGIAARVESLLLKRLLEERTMLLELLEACDGDGHNCEAGDGYGPPDSCTSCMRVSALAFAKEPAP